MLGLQLIPPSVLEERDKVIYQARSLIPVEDELATHIKKHWEINLRHKQTSIEPRLDSCFRARAGEYDPAQLALLEEMGGSTIYIMLAAAKMRALSAWITDIMLPANDRPWDLEATPLPDMPDDAKTKIKKLAADAAAQKIGQLMARGEHVTAEMAQSVFDDFVATITEEIEQEVKEDAEKAIKNMVKLIEDQLQEGDFYDCMESFIEDFCTYPVGIIKGPIPTHNSSLRWKDGQLALDERLGWRFERVSPYDIYPSPKANKIDAGHLIEHMRLDPETLHNLIGLEGYREDKIRAVLSEVQLNSYKASSWLNIMTDNKEQTSNSDFFSNQDSDTIDALHYWGAVPGRILLDWGMSKRAIPDPEKSYQIDAILIDKYVIRAVLNDDPLFRRPYAKASFQNVPGDFWGLSLYETMEDVQRMANSAARSLATNMAFAAGPQIGVAVDALDNPSDADDIVPLKIWRLKRNPLDGQQQRIPIEFYQPSINAQQLLPVLREFEEKADLVTGVPKYASGNPEVGGAGRTARGLALLMESAAKGVRKAIMNIDRGVIRRIIKIMWYYNMRFVDDPSIKGDAKVVARGASALIAKDSLQAKRAELLQLTNSEIDIELIGLDSRAKLLHSMYVEAGLGDVLPSVSEMVERANRRLEQQKAMEQQPDPMRDAEIEKTKAEAQAEQAKAAKEMAEMLKDNPTLKAAVLAQIAKG